MRPPLRLLLACLGLVISPVLLVAVAPSDRELTTVFSTVHNGYVKPVDADGKPMPATYVMTEGTFNAGGLADLTLDRLTFRQLAGILARPLALQGYVSGQPDGQIDQLLVIHWGRTAGYNGGIHTAGYDSFKQAGMGGAAVAPAAPNDNPFMGGSSAESKGPPAPAQNNQLGTDANAAAQAMMMIQLQNEQRDLANERNARLLGYYEELAGPKIVGAVGNQKRSLRDEVEEDRYFVVVMAYDFATLRDTRQRKLLWVTRFSLPAHGNAFDGSVAAMAKAAAAHFGRSTNGLHREEIQTGRVDIGELKVLGTEEAPRR